MDDEEPTEPAGRDWTRIALLAGIILAAVTAAMLVPSLASDSIRGSPIDSVLPGEQFDDGRGAGGDGTGFGALNPDDSTGVGGETGFDKDTFGNNDTEVHFEVESSASTYWRTGTYGVYTGTGWERDVETRPYEGSIETEGLAGEEIVYEVEFERAASALPTAWRPTSVNGIDGLEVTETGSVLVPDTVDAGASFSGVSNSPVRDVDVLQSAGSSYPEDIQRRYTQLPDETPERVEEFTDELTRDDETPYDTAKTIQDWLRSEKGYSLQASRQSDHMADTFIFEMEEGYCEYFATAMTAMLRSQGVPARYTVGYTTGQQVEGNRYQVRGMNAHAWVEVYFPDVGWVRFDPTPGGSRLDAQQDALEAEEPGLEYNATEAGSPGEVFEPGEVRDVSDEGDENGDENGDEDDGTLDVSLNRTAVPGLPVEVSVTQDDSPVPGATVLFNGEAVGVTDDDGTVVATVPEADELRIGVEPSVNESEETSDNSGTIVPPQPGSESRDGRYLSLGSTEWASAGLQQGDENVTVVDVETEASISVTGDQFPGENVTVVVTVDGIPIESAALYLDGQRVGTTDGDGRSAVTLPSDAGNSTIAAERGPVFGQTDVRVQAIELDVSAGLLALPLTEATAEVTADGEGIADAPIRMDGSEVARTGPDGTASVRLPLSASVTLATQQGAITRETTVDGLFRNAAAVVGGVGIVIGVPLVVAYRRGYRPRDLASGVVTAVARVTGVVAGLGRSAAATLRAAVTRVSKTLIHLARFAAGQRSAAELGAALLGWLRAKRAQLAGAVQFGGPDPSNTGDGKRADVGEPVPTVRAAWHRFLATIDADDPETKTPGELAEHAIEGGNLPEPPVKTLRDAFREVEYGDRPATDRAERVRAAIESIERAAGGSSADGDDPGEGGSGAPDGVPDDGTGSVGEPTEATGGRSPGLPGASARENGAGHGGES